MARPILDEQLRDISEHVKLLGQLVNQTLEQALEAVEKQDKSLSGLVIASETFIGETRREIERLAFRSLILQQPLAGRDLRFLSSAPSIAAELAHIGHNAIGTAALIVRIVPLRTSATTAISIFSQDQSDSTKRSLTEASIISGILDLGKEARRVLQETINTFSTNDVETARKIWLEEDDLVDVRYHAVQNDLMSMLSGVHAVPAAQSDPNILQRLTYWLWIAHNLERVGDHCINLCERIIFIIEGDININPATARKQ